MLTQNYIPHQLKAKIEREIEPGEQFVWIDKPIPRFFVPSATGAFLFGIPWTAFAIFWTAGAAWGTFNSPGAGWFRLFPLFGLPFILIGIGMLTSPLWAYRKSLNTVFVITDRRAIIFDGLRTTTIRSFAPKHLGELYRREKNDGSGDVVIARNSWRDSDGDRSSEELGFMRVRDAKAVESLLKELGKKAGGTTPGESRSGG